MPATCSGLVLPASLPKHHSSSSRPMLSGAFRRALQPQIYRPTTQRWASSSISSTAANRWRPRRVVLGAGALLIGLGTFKTFTRPVHSDTDEQDEHKDSSAKTTDNLRSLIRSYVVYSLCSVPAVVDSAPKLLEVFTSVWGIRQITEALVRVTFFDQFVGGDTALETVPLLQRLRSANKGALFAYSIEVDESEATTHGKTKHITASIHKRIVNEMVRCIDVAADFEDETLKGSQTGRRTWVAVKMTALLPDAQSLINFSKYLTDTRPPLAVPFPGCPRATDLDVLYSPSGSARGPLTDDDVSALRELHDDLRRICSRAQERGVKIILDAEYSWYQPAIDTLQLALMREFNRQHHSSSSTRAPIQPLIYGTFQAYLRRTSSYLLASFEDAEKHGYTLGVKLVRGAYHPHEVSALEARKKGEASLAITPEDVPPVWSTKEETDKCYDECAKMLVGAIKDDIQQGAGKTQKIGVLFGTHNWKSSKLILSELVRVGIAREERSDEKEGVVVLGDEVTERLTMGQLYGMNDALSDYLVRRTKSSAPMVIKYVPYGALSEVMPYLSRRAIENRSVLGNGVAREEVLRARRAIFEKIFG